MDPSLRTATSEKAVVDPTTGINSQLIEECAIAEKALIRKVDWRLLPILGALYAIALIDRINISNARVAGMLDELDLHIGSRYSIALLVFFIPYFIFELPSNIILRRVGSANWLAFISFAWGSFMMGTGFINSYQALVAFRFMIGFFEAGNKPYPGTHGFSPSTIVDGLCAGFFPGCVYLISCWYVRYEVQTRLAIFYLFSVLIGGFSAILAFGLMQMEGLRGYRGWRWIFIIEGLITQVVGLLSWFLIIDFPDKIRERGFLSAAEAKYIQHRINIDRSDADPDPLTVKRFCEHLLDSKLWVFGLMFMCTTTSTYAFAYFAPVIILGMGHSAGIANLLSAPPVVAAVISALTISWLSDKYRLRAPAIAFQCVLGIIGLMLTAYGQRNGVRYFGLFLGAMGSQGNIPAVLAYQSNNIRCQSKRAVGSALQIGFGAIGGIIASTTFRQQDAPNYIPGLWVTTGLQFVILMLVAGLSMYFWMRNKQIDNGTAKKPIEGLEGFKFTL